ncbi:hypothetical protein EVAR_10444_1 [Eumeta japonica]|uniref:Uncharacterized protein n=1 Tax=Eumeta variegata TaxID=151549 RepID=A0A4C1TH81_EUMVA|nr:hypothetical protein EVAR_10444_1 [Eumeta japonica]
MSKSAVKLAPRGGRPTRAQSLYQHKWDLALTSVFIGDGSRVMLDNKTLKQVSQSRNAVSQIRRDKRQPSELFSGVANAAATFDKPPAISIAFFAARFSKYFRFGLRFRGQL